MTDFLETTVDKFTFRVATDRQYSREGLWVAWLGRRGKGRVRVGVTDCVQQRSGDATFVTVRPVGTRLAAGDDLADLETIKVDLVLPSPVAGSIAAVNEALVPHPELVNQSPYAEGWLAEIEVGDGPAAGAALLDPEAYFVLMKGQAEAEAKKP